MGIVVSIREAEISCRGINFVCRDAKANRLDGVRLRQFSNCRRSQLDRKTNRRTAKKAKVFNKHK